MGAGDMAGCVKLYGAVDRREEECAGSIIITCLQDALVSPLQPSSCPVSLLAARRLLTSAVHASCMDTSCPPPSRSDVDMHTSEAQEHGGDGRHRQRLPC